MIYYGQTRRKILDRHAEHMSAIENKKRDESAVADHVFDFPTHSIDSSKVKNVKVVNNEKQLNAWESLFICNSKNPLMNKDPPRISSPLFKFLEIPELF